MLVETTKKYSACHETQVNSLEHFDPCQRVHMPSNLTLQLQQIVGFPMTRVKGNGQGNQTLRTDYCIYFSAESSICSTHY